MCSSELSWGAGPEENSILLYSFGFPFHHVSSCYGNDACVKIDFFWCAVCTTRFVWLHRHLGKPLRRPCGPPHSFFSRTDDGHLRPLGGFNKDCYPGSEPTRAWWLQPTARPGQIPYSMLSITRVPSRCLSPLSLFVNPWMCVICCNHDSGNQDATRD